MSPQLREALGGLDIESLSSIDRARILELLRRRRRIIAEHRAQGFRPYAKQLSFFAAGKSYRERLLMAGNQLGKCRLVSSLIPLADGRTVTMGELFALAEPVEVLAWDGARTVAAPISHVVCKGPEPCVEVLLANGERFQAALDHQVLTGAGYVAFSRLLASVPCLPATSWAPGLSARDEGDRRWSGTTQDSRGRCSPDCRHGGAPLRSGEVCVRGVQPSPDDARQRSLASWTSGAFGRPTDTSTGQPESGLPSSWCGRLRCAVRSAVFLARAAYTTARSRTANSRGVQPLLAASASLLRSVVAALPGRGLAGVESLVTPSGEGNQIIGYRSIGSHELYDLTVPGYHNYIADGLVHHNTLSGGFEIAAHATGEYPDWWPGRRYDRPTRGWVSGVTGESTRDNPQRILMGGVGQWGTGMIPKKRIKKIVKAAHGVSDLLDMVFVEHVSGGESMIAFKSYEKGREKWQGETLDYVWFDEEPPLEIYSEGLTRTQAVGGFVIVTFTPLLGMSDTVKRFIVDKTPGTHVTSMTIYDVDHYTDDERAIIIAGYPPHERDARASGIPILGSGRIFPVEELTIKEGRIDIPNHWPRIVGLDFGWTHPTAALWAAWDRDTDTIHLYDEHRASQTLTIVHAHALKSRGDWIPVAWPHDGENGTAAGEGVALASQYRKHGVRMLPERAQFSDGTISTEAANMALLNRMMTGRLKVASHLEGWWEEFRLYHRKDGKIVKKNDDLMSAMHKIEMSLRYADVAPALMPWNTMPVGVSMLDAEVGF